MCSILSLVVLICITKFSEPYRIVVDDPNNSYHYEKEQDDQGNYNFENFVYEDNSQSNKRISHQETGTLHKSNSGEEYIAVQGEYYYKENQYIYKVVYEADENGFRARVERIPDSSTGPPKEPKPPVLHDPGIGAADPISSHAITSLQGGG